MRTPATISQAVAEILREHAEQTFMTQTELARRTGISQSQISKFFRAERQMTIAQLVSLCDELQLSVVAVIAEAAGPSD
ncbi:helix-turn-helix domain-containing protein [Microbacterium allomyrinae]|uniref:Helix-turn-helix transcriptional regulator n=1 Tax=Microbacterium allomyrinae TaxID=2830666 RepID=A0A9X1LRY9_9MICO|nr:helix-turn-helix transcriptional regulator [Microbacterium allomyrinae]MCC2030651.1 helix-turn-helix transcriptional regulator [Microbacterium allomyrinae]